MPIYEYDCPSCGRFEQIQKVSEKPLKTCPSCAEKGKKSTVERLVSSAAFHLKGSGWYKTDYASSSKTGSSKSAKADSTTKTESTKTESASESGGSTGSDASGSSKAGSGSSKPEGSSGGGSSGGGCGSGACGCH